MPDGSSEVVGAQHRGDAPKRKTEPALPVPLGRPVLSVARRFPVDPVGRMEGGRNLFLGTILDICDFDTHI